MRISDLYSAKGPVFSFEFFPPKTEKGFRSLYRTIGELRGLGPGFVSVTMGAGGSTRSKTVDLVIDIERDLGLTAMTHLPCVGFNRADVSGILATLGDAGMQNVLALRGDPPRDAPDFVPAPDGFNHAAEIVAFLREDFDFCIGAAAFPEVHPEAPDAETDLRHLVAKVAAGSDFLITQFFFDNAAYFDFCARAKAAGIEIPIVPGIMPITSTANVKRMASLGGGTLPPELLAAIDACNGDDERTAELGIDWATSQCRELLDAGAPGIHFYTLNRSPATRRIHTSLFA
jgi:methylenetetrahydrofolate reductase (NADPH)